MAKGTMRPQTRPPGQSTILLCTHSTSSTITFDTVAELRVTIAERDETIIEENIFDNDDKNGLNNNTVRLHVHKTNDNTVAMMGKMSIKLPTPTQFDGKNPQFNEKINSQQYLQKVQTNTRSTQTTLNIRKKKDDIMSSSQTLNYSSKSGSEAHSIVRRIMRQSSAFEAWRQLMLHHAGGRRAQQFSLLRTIVQPSAGIQQQNFFAMPCMNTSHPPSSLGKAAKLPMPASPPGLSW
eukprot:4606404-Amphidinium_carterae.1